MNRKTTFLRWLMLFAAGLFVLNATTYAQNREIGGDVTTSSMYTAGATSDLDFTISAFSPDWEYIDEFSLVFPAGVTINSATQIDFEDAVIAGQTISWDTYFDPEDGDVDFSVNVTVDAAFTGNMSIDWHIEGDYWGDPPNSADGTVVVPVAAPRLEVTPLVLDLGDRPINSWTEPAYFTLTNTGTGSLTVNNVELDAADFFAVVGDFPIMLEAGESAEVGVSATGDAAPGMLTGDFVAQWGASRAVVVTEFMANAYEPIPDDVVETATELDVAPAPAGPTSLPMASTRESGGIYKNYILPNDVGSGPNDNDFVYLLEPTTDVLLDLFVTVGTVNFAIYDADFGGEGGPMATNALVQGVDNIDDFELFAGSYYMVGSSLDSWGGGFNVTAMPAPDAVVYNAPLDGAVDITNGDDLEWTFGANTLEYELVLGTTYPPATVVVPWTSDLAEAYTLVNTQPNLQYFWQVNVRNGNGSTPGPIWGFTTTLTPPAGLTGNAEVYEGEDVVLTWESPVDRAFLGYNVYRDGGVDPLNPTMLTEATYTDVAPAYNMAPGYEYTVTAIFDEGESDPSDPFTAQVTGEGTLNGNVSSLVPVAPVSGATVTMVGVDEFGEDQTYSTTTDASGNYTADVYAGTYDIRVSAEGFINAEVTGVAVAYGATVTTDFDLMETAYPVAVVTASEFGENILIEWSFDAVNFTPQVYPFETAGMSDAQINKMWNGFLAENNFDATAQGSDRALVEFQVWREKAYLPGAFEMIGTTSQMQFVDFDWGLQDWGVYKWYVVAVYDLNESAPVASNAIDNDMNVEVDVTVALNSAESPAGTMVEFTNVDESPELVYATLLPASGEFTWDEFRRGTYDIMVSYPGYGVINETAVDIFDDASFEWLLEETLATPAELYVTPTGLATWAGGSGEVPFAPVMVDFNDGLPADWTVEAGPNSTVADNWEWNDGTGFRELDETGFAIIDSDDAGSGVTVDGYFISSVIDASNADMLYIEFDQYFWSSFSFGDIASVEVFDGTDWVLVLEQSATVGAWGAPDHKVIDVTDYANDAMQVRFHYDDDGLWAWYWGIDNVSITNVAPVVPRSFETYKIFLDGTLLGEVTEEEYQHGGFGETLVDGEVYTTGVAAVFTTGQSATAEFTWLYVACENYAAPTAFTAEQTIGTLDVVLDWTNVDAAALDTISALRVYRNGEELTELDFTAGAVETYTDEELEFGTYTYCLTYVYDSGAETCVDGVCSEEVVITGGGYVNGTVTAFDGGAAIEGASVMIYNEDYSFEFTTDLNGYYEGEVVDGIYDYMVSAATFESQMLEDVTITFGETVTNDFSLLEFPYPVSGVVATELTDNSVLVDWSAQAPVVSEWLVYDNDVMGFTGIGAEVADYSLIWASKFVPAQLTEYGTGFVTKVSVYQGTPAGDFVTEVRILGGENGETVLYTQDVTGTLTSDSWNIIELDEAVAFDNTENLWIAMYVERPGDTANEPTADAIEVLSDRYDYFAYNGADWTSISSEYGITDQAWMLRGYVTTSAGREVALGQGDYTTTGHKDYSTVKSVKSGKGMIAASKPNTKFPVYANESNRELVGYKIYRTTCETGDLTFLGLTLDEQFTDNTWGAATSGVYKWGVVAEYDNNESEVVFSNCLDKDMITTVSVSVITNSGDSPEETDVMFTNVSEPGLELTYEVELDETGFFAWDEFRKGEYDIYVEKNGFAPIMLEGYLIDGPEAFEWILDELLLPVSDLYVTPTGFATWRQGGIIPFEPFMENFDEGLPETWTVVDGGSTTDTWYNETPAGNPQSAGSSLDGTPFMFADSDEAGSGATMDEQLISPVINGENADELYLMFDYLYINLSTTEYFSVDVYDGDDWVEVFFSQEDSGSWPWDVATTETIDVTEYANEMFQVRFNYFSPGWNWYVAVDNVVVTDNMDRYADRELTNYKVWLDGIFLTDTEETFYQYATENLVPGQEYLAEVAAMYTTGMSAKMQYVWTYVPCEDYAGPEVYTAEVVDENDVLLTWSDVEPMTIVQITQNPGAPANGYFQSFGFGYGVAYDLSAYPDALVNSLDFHHASWGTTGTWEYNIHIYDWDTKTLIETVGPISTTGNDIWEMGVELGDISVAGVNTVALLMEPLGNTAADAYPDLSSDDATNPQGSIYGDLSDPNAIGSSTIGNFLMDMYIYTAYGPVRATPVSFDYVQAPVAQAKAAVNPATEAPVISQNAVTSRDEDPFVGVNVYRDGMMIAEMVQDTFYLDEDLGGGEFTYCIRYVYESGAMTCEDAYCLDVAIPCEAPENLTGEYVWEYNDGNPEFGAMIEWEAGAAPVAEWLYYDDGVNVDGIGGPATFTWAIKFDPAQLADYDGASLTKIEIYNRVAGSNELRIYEGTNAATLLHTQTLSGLGIETWEEVDLTDAVMLDVTKELWIAVYTADGAVFPAGCGNYTGNPNSDLITLDGVLWEHLNDLALPYTWNLRGYVTTMSGATAALPMDKPQDEYNNSDRAELTISGMGTGENPVLASSSTRELSMFNVYRSEDGTDYEMIATVPFESGTNMYSYYDTESGIGDFYYQVTAHYMYEDGSECESAPAMALDIPEDDFVYVFVTDVNELGAVEVRLFPNPATENVNIEAANMNRITVINAVGQVVYDREISAERTQLNVASYEAGIYMVRINTETGLVTKRMTIVR